MNDLENAYLYCLIFFEGIIGGIKVSTEKLSCVCPSDCHTLTAGRNQHAPMPEKLIPGLFQYFTSASSPRPVKMP